MFYFIINPVAGTGNFTELESKFRAQLTEFGIEGEFVKTINSGDAIHLAKVGLRKGHRKMVCVGGDGTVNEIVNGIAGEDVLLAIIPWGKKNTIAGALGIPLNWKSAIKVLLAEEEQVLQLGLVKDRFFVALAGLGEKHSKANKKGLFTTKEDETDPYPLTLLVDDALKLRTNVKNVSILNISSASEDLKSLVSDPHDDKFELVIQSFTTNLDAEKTSYLRCAKLKISSRDLVPVHVDYEGLRLSLPFEIKIAGVEQRFLVV